MKILFSIKTTVLSGLFLAVVAMLFYGGYQFYQQQFKWQESIIQLNNIEDGYEKWINWSTVKSNQQYALTDVQDVKQSFEKQLSATISELKKLLGSDNLTVLDLGNKLEQSLESYGAFLVGKAAQLKLLREINESISALKLISPPFSSVNNVRITNTEQAFFINPDSAETAHLNALYDEVFIFDSTSRGFAQRRLLLETMTTYQKQKRLLAAQENAFLLADNLFRQSWNSANQQLSLQQNQHNRWVFVFFGAIIAALLLSMFFLIRYTKNKYYYPLNTLIKKLSDAEKGLFTAELDQINSLNIPDELAILANSLNKVIDKLNIQRDALSFLSLEDSTTSNRVGFMAAAAREIRTPLNNLTNTINQLLDSEAMKSEWADDIKELHHSSFQLLALINQVVDLSKLQEGTLRLVIKPSSLLEQIQTICDIYRAKFEGKGVAFRLVLDESDIPEVVETDAVRLNQILLSILQQAWRKTNRGSVTLEINCVRKLTNECLLRFVITDTGEGYEDHDLEILNKNEIPVFDIDSHFTGILLSKSLLSYFNTTISIDTEPELGTSIAFNMSFPIVHQLHNKAKTVLLTKMVDQVVAPIKRILIVDDNPVNLKITARILQKDMYNCSLATNAAEALELIAKDEKFDLILMDLEMPGMDGISCTEYIRQSSHAQAKTVPIIALTASSSDQIKEKAFMRGMNDYITKPFTPLELLNVVAKNIDLAKQFGHTA